MKKKNPQEFLLKRMRRKNKNGNTTTGTNTATPSRSHSIDENSPEIGQFYANNNATNTIPASIMSGNADMKGNVRFPTQNMDTLIAIPPLEDRVRSDDEKEVHGSPDSEKQDMDIEEKANFSPEENAQKPGFMGKFTNKLRKRSSETPETPETPSSGDNVRPVSREGTWFSRNSHDEKTFLGATREFGLSTKAIPGKLLKGGYRKIVHHQPGNKQAKIAQSSTHQAKVLAKRIYHNLIGPDSTREYVVEYDLHPFFNTRKEAAAAFELFDTDGNGDISKRELRSGCIRIYRERKNLARSMRDLSQATGKLDILLMTVFIVVWVNGIS
jgi:hypothetical protein